MKFQILNARSTEDREIWTRFYSRRTKHEVFAHPAYVSLFAREQDEALAALAEDEHGAVIYCFVSRPIDSKHLAVVADGARDLTSPYGYGGPFMIGRLERERFWAEFDA